MAINSNPYGWSWIITGYKSKVSIRLNNC